MPQKLRVGSPNISRAYRFLVEADLPDEVVADPAYAFRVWLVPKTAKSARQADLSIEFVSASDLTAEQREALEQSIVAVRTVAKEVDLWERYGKSRDDLAKELGLTGPKTSALIRELKLRDDPASFRVLTRKKSKFDGYSDQALKQLRAALDGGIDVEEVWLRHRHAFGAKKRA